MKFSSVRPRTLPILLPALIGLAALEPLWPCDTLAQIIYTPAAPLLASYARTAPDRKTVLAAPPEYARG